MPEIGGRLVPPVTRLMSGDEAIAGAGATVKDFWSWAMSDLRTNTVRPLLAEFLVAQALGAALRPRIEWDAYDVCTENGLTVEVKSSAYLQAWSQAGPSTISFGGLRGRLAGVDGRSASAQTYNAHVYVFALLTATDHSVYDALDVDQWSFWVLPRAVVAGTRQMSIGLARVKALAGDAIGLSELAAGVHRAHEEPT